MSRIHGRFAGMALAGLMALAVGACDSFLDVNENPNSPESVRMELTFPAMLMEHTSELAEDRLAPADGAEGGGAVGCGEQDDEESRGRPIAVNGFWMRGFIRVRVLHGFRPRWLVGAHGLTFTITRW